MELAIRAARADDLPRLVELCQALDVGHEPALSAERAHRHFQELSGRPQHCIYVAEQRQRIIGTFALVFVGGLAHGARDSCVIEDVVVAEEARGAGVGTRMMQFAMDVCAGQGCYKLVLSSHVDRVRAHRFYERLGFKRHGYSFLIDRLE